MGTGGKISQTRKRDDMGSLPILRIGKYPLYHFVHFSVHVMKAFGSTTNVIEAIEEKRRHSKFSRKNLQHFNDNTTKHSHRNSNLNKFEEIENMKQINKQHWRGIINAEDYGTQKLCQKLKFLHRKWNK